MVVQCGAIAFCSRGQNVLQNRAAVPGHESGVMHGNLQHDCEQEQHGWASTLPLLQAVALDVIRER